MALRSFPRYAVLASVATASLALSACGSSSLGGSSSSTSSATSSDTSSSSSTSSETSSGGGEDLSAMVPDKIKAAGKIVIGSDASYAPNEFLADDGKTVQGMDVDVFDAVAAKLGLKTEYQNAGFDTIILGVQSGKYDVGVSSFTINDERKQAVNMISYFNAGTQWAVAKGNPKGVDPNNACGLAVGVQKGTVQADDIAAKSKECTDAGNKAIDILIEQEQSKVTADVIAGKVDAMLADSPIAAYAVAQTGDQLETVGDIYDSAPYGFVVPKDQTDFANAIAKALAAIKADGSYDAALQKWGNEGGAIDTFAVNP